MKISYNENDSNKFVIQPRATEEKTGEEAEEQVRLKTAEAER